MKPCPHVVPAIWVREINLVRRHVLLMQGAAQLIALLRRLFRIGRQFLLLDRHHDMFQRERQSVGTACLAAFREGGNSALRLQSRQPWGEGAYEPLER